MERQLSHELNQSVRELLPPEEKIVWSGQPRIKLFRPADFIAIPFMIGWTSIAATTIVQVGSEHFPLVLSLLPAAFVLLGLYMLVGRYLHEYYVLKNCYFVLTASKAYVITTLLGRQVRTVPYDQNTTVVAVQDKGAISSILFEDVPDWQLSVNQRQTAMMLLKQKTPIFFGLTEAAMPAVEHLNSRTQLRLSEQPSGIYALAKSPSALPSRQILSSSRWSSTGSASASSGSASASSGSASASSGSASASLGSAPVGSGSASASSISASPDFQRVHNVPSFVSQNEFQLLQDETILWQGKPEVAFRLRKTDLCWIPGCLLFCGAAAILLSLFIGRIVSPTILFAGITVFMFLLSAVSEVWMKWGTKYAITNRRVVALWQQVPSMVRQYSIDFDQINSIDYSSANDDSGTIVFNRRDTLLIRWFGAEGIALDPSVTNRLEPFLLDVPKVRSVLRVIEQQRESAKLLSRTNKTEDISVQHSLPLKAPRTLPAGFGRRLLFDTAGAKIGFFVSITLLVIASFHFAGSGWTQLQALLLLVIAGRPLAADSMPAIFLLIPVFMFSIAIGIIIHQFRRAAAQLRLLKEGVMTRGSYLTEMVTCQTNGRPTFVQREYAFTDQKGVRRQATAHVSASTPIRREVTILFDHSNPAKSVVMEELPGQLTLTEDGAFTLQS